MKDCNDDDEQDASDIFDDIADSSEPMVIDLMLKGDVWKVV